MNKKKQYSYDEVPYGNGAFSQSHPDKLATMGYLFGLEPKPIEKCRVLELGSARGGNLIPMSFYLPNSEFIGIDLSEKQVQMANKVIKNLKLKNISIKNGSILDINKSWGKFDYIICHGVFSWVSYEVQEKIFEIFSNNLSKNGIGYVSYNCYPGWHMHEIIRHIMLYHIKLFKDSTKQIKQARAIIDFLCKSVSDQNTPYSQFLINELKKIKKSKDWYLFHDLLEEHNTPIYFHQFMERALKYNLQYLCETELSEMLTDNFSKDIRDTLNQSDNIIKTQQYMDFINNRVFRQSLLCLKNINLNRKIEPNLINNLRIAAPVNLDLEPIEIMDKKSQKFYTISKEKSVKTNFILTKAALVVLGECWPLSLDFETLWQKSIKKIQNLSKKKDINTDKNRSILKKDLLQGYVLSFIKFHIYQANFKNTVSAYPKANNLIRYLAKNDQNFYLNAFHSIITVDNFAKKIICYLNGKNNHKKIQDLILQSINNGEITLYENEKKIKTQQKIKKTIKTNLEKILHKFAKLGVLT